MTKPIGAVIGLIAGSVQLVAAQGFGSLTGTVRNTAGTPLNGAEVTVDDERVVVSPQGNFRFDRLSLGTHLIMLRLVGYSPLRSTVAVQNGTSHYDYVLHPAPHVLPSVAVEARRSGIYGTVGDTSFKPLVGARVQLAGKGGGDVLTDSSGRFEFPVAADGQYLVRAVLRGYEEQRLFVELKKREGVQISLRLRPSYNFPSRESELAVHDLGRRLVANLREDRLTPSQLDRYGSRSLCEVNRIAAKVSRPRDSLTIILNGTVVLEKRSVRDLCVWQAADVELVEFGENPCRDATRSLVDMLNVWCRNLTGRDRGIGQRGRIRTQREGGPFVVIWERR